MVSLFKELPCTEVPFYSTFFANYTNGHSKGIGTGESPSGLNLTVLTIHVCNMAIHEVPATEPFIINTI